MNGDVLELSVIEEQADESIRRTIIDGVWYFSVIDVIAILTDAPKPRQYWFNMKRYVTSEGFDELSQKVRQLKLTATDGKERLTDAADLQTMLRIVQSVPSPKAEPIKQWLAKVGARTLQTPYSPQRVTVPAPTTPIAEAWMTHRPSDGDLMGWAEFLERIAVVYRQQASLESRLRSVESLTRLHDTQLAAILFRLDALEEAQTQLPDILAMLQPERLTPLHQEMIRRWTLDLARVSGWPTQAIYMDMLAEFGINGLHDSHEADWEHIYDWFQDRLSEARKRR